MRANMRPGIELNRAMRAPLQAEVHDGDARTRGGEALRHHGAEEDGVESDSGGGVRGGGGDGDSGDGVSDLFGRFCGGREGSCVAQL